MDTLTTSMPIHLQSSNYDDISMQESLPFADSLKDLKNLSTQLYSAAEYFEISYSNDDQKQIVVDTLKDYAVKAIVNTVDHLGFATYKVNGFLDEKVEEVSGTELCMSCIEQRLRTCQEYMDRQGLAQQSSFISTPRQHKRYVLPAGETLNSKTNLRLKEYSRDDEDWPHFRSGIRGATFREISSPALGKGQSPSPSQLARTFSFSGVTSKKDSGRAASPHQFPFARSGSVAARPTSPQPVRSTSPYPAVEREWRHFTALRKSSTVRIQDDDRGHKGMEIERHPSKSKGILKSLLSGRKSKKDDMLYTYLAEY